MKFNAKASLMLALMGLTVFSAKSQTVSSGNQIIDKTEYSGLILTQNIQEKYLSSYWESYLDRFGKVKGRRGSFSIAKAAISSVSNSPVKLTSQVSSERKDASKLFVALNVDGNFITSSDRAYNGAESMLKDFSNYASAREEVRIADESFTNSEKSYQKLQRDIEDKIKEIDKTEKKLAEMRDEVEKERLESQKMLADLQNKQKTLESVKARVR